MSCEYNTEIKVNGTSDECTRMVQYLQQYFEESREAQFGKFHVLSEASYQALLNAAAAGHFAIDMEGPFCGPFLLDDIEIFMRMAETVPTCNFYGRMHGADSGSEQSFRAKLEDGLLYQWFDYHSYDDWDDFDYEEEETLIPLFADPKKSVEKKEEEPWGVPYDPVKKIYLPVIEKDRVAREYEEGARLEVRMEYEYNSEREKAGFYVDFESFEQPLTLRSYPNELLKGERPGSFLEILSESLDGQEAEKVSEAILSQKESIIGNASEGIMTGAKITLIHGHQNLVLFEKLEPKLKKIYKNVCKEKPSGTYATEEIQLSFFGGKPIEYTVRFSPCK